MVWAAQKVQNSISRIMRKVKSIQRSGTETIRTQIQPSKPKREITKVKNKQNAKRTRLGQPSEQLLPEKWPLSNPNRTKNNMKTRFLYMRKQSRYINSTAILLSKFKIASL